MARRVLTAAGSLDPSAVSAVDSTGQAQEILDLPLHLRDALWRVDSASLGDLDAPGGLFIAGQGGSAVGGRLARGALGPQVRRPMILAEGYRLPPWIDASAVVLVASYSGATEEALACYAEAGERGLRRVAATTGGRLAELARGDGVPVVPLPGGFQPRAAVGYSTVVALELAALTGAGPDLRDAVEAAARLTERLAQEWSPAAREDAEAKRIARALHGRVPIIVGAEMTSTVAFRWMTQIHENAKQIAFAGQLPEANHNAIEGWTTAGADGPFTIVMLEHAGLHPRNAVRKDLTERLLADAGMPVLRVRARGESRLEHLLSLVLLGDLVSVYLAVLRGVDPVEIAAIDELKRLLNAR
jgi:glucose/mannose-6-phosphate isomerase